MLCYYINYIISNQGINFFVNKMQKELPSHQEKAALFEK
jgi:hypothetical protein